MKPARIVILTVAVAAAGLAGYIAMNMSAPRVVTEVLPQPERIEVEDVLVAGTSLATGSQIAPDTLKWQEWPKNGLSEGFITRSARPDAIEELEGAVVRMPIFAGEPMRTEKIVDANARVMSSLLPAGKRAVATEITVATGAGGFILPNDRVDIIMVRSDDTGGYSTQVVLQNIRVLAIDQTIQETEDGSQAVVGSTATLELTPDQARVIAVAQEMAAKLTLALRSVADADQPDTGFASQLIAGGAGDAIQLIRNGTIETVGQ